MARVATFPREIVYLDEPPDVLDYNLHLPDIVRNNDSRNTLDVLAAICLRVKRLQINGNVVFSKHGETTFFDAETCSEDQHITTDYVGSSQFIYRQVQTLSNTGGQVDPDGVDFTERLMARTYNADGDEIAKSGFLQKWTEGVAANPFVISRMASMSGTDHYETDGGVGPACGDATIPFSGDPPPGEDYYQPVVSLEATIMVVPGKAGGRKTHDVYAQVTATVALVGNSEIYDPASAGFIFSLDYASFSTVKVPGTFDTPCSGGLSIIVPAYGNFISGGGFGIISLPFYTNNFNLPPIATFTVDTGTNVITTSVPHNLSVGDVFIVSSSIALPGGMAANTNYYVLTVPTPTSLTVSTTISGATELDITAEGIGTHTMDYRTPTISAVCALDYTIAGVPDNVLPYGYDHYDPGAYTTQFQIWNAAGNAAQNPIHPQPARF